MDTDNINTILGIFPHLTKLRITQVYEARSKNLESTIDYFLTAPPEDHQPQIEDNEQDYYHGLSSSPTTSSAASPASNPKFSPFSSPSTPSSNSRPNPTTTTPSYTSKPPPSTSNTPKNLTTSQGVDSIRAEFGLLLSGDYSDSLFLSNHVTDTDEEIALQLQTQLNSESDSQLLSDHQLALSLQSQFSSPNFSPVPSLTPAKPQWDGHSLPFDPKSDAWQGAESIVLDKAYHVPSKEEVLRLMNKGQKNEYMRIFTILKPSLQKAFESKRQEYCERYGKRSGKSKVRLAFHATGQDRVFGIVSSGLVVPGSAMKNGEEEVKHRTDNGWYGKGIYLTPEVKTAKSYGRTLLVCAVLLGRVFRAKTRMDGQGLMEGYDSHREPFWNKGLGKEWILFSSDQVLPIYIVQM
eukprot:TRINITY_DN1623_c0_g3_i1.p1 TRINITY_DN1623_c0_g3~~TRINITY_DN1623_c0_g3_i1.p1  ORF type:complete len:408 (+),score=72.98 TRINITY_DN1623_c0_g3_i1:75-1298(+)